MVTPRTGRPRGRPRGSVKPPERDRRDSNAVAFAEAVWIVYRLSRRQAFDLAVAVFRGRGQKPERLSKRLTRMQCDRPDWVPVSWAIHPMTTIAGTSRALEQKAARLRADPVSAQRLMRATVAWVEALRERDPAALAERVKHALRAVD